MELPGGIPGVECDRGSSSPRVRGNNLPYLQPTFWARRIDDTFTIDRRDQVGALEKRPNSIFPGVKFTMELEKDKQLSLPRRHGDKDNQRRSDSHGLSESLDQCYTSLATIR